MTVVSQVDPRLLLDEALSTSDLERSTMCTSALATLDYMRRNGSIGLTKSGAFNLRFAGERTVLDNSTMAFREAGDARAPTALFLHGNPTSSYIWRNILATIRA